jgi:DNA-binding PadR family transcriptional regulator
MLKLEKWQELLLAFLKYGSLSFSQQRTYNSRNAFYSVIKSLLESGYVKNEENHDQEKIYSLTLKGEMLARIIR